MQQRDHEHHRSLARDIQAMPDMTLGRRKFLLADIDASSGYSARVRKLAGITCATGNVLSDGTAPQIASVTASASLGCLATLTVGVSL